MERIVETGLSALVTGTVAAVVSAAALGILARVERKGALQPINATSHWLEGDAAADRRSADLAHTAVGAATHHASAVFWALSLELWLSRHPPRTTAVLLRDAAAMSAIAAAVDYGAVPRRFTPGWELVVSRRSLAVAYGALAIGLAAGSIVSASLRRTRPGW